ncbi:MAG TPA: hypothetical protein VFW33_21310 [Gemmataceae bacterium]|nr:hypothetical protein [Gemmataceae bacterium]
MRGRVYIPIHQDGVLVGWQGRLVEHPDPPPGDDPRYFTMAGLRKSQLLYNQDTARRPPLVVVCEGCADVWGVGPAGVALLGKTPSLEQLRLLATLWRGRPAVVLLDPDAEADARDLAERLRPLFPGRLVLALLPEGLDPGACPRRPLWDLLRSRAADHRVELPLSDALLGRAR